MSEEEIRVEIAKLCGWKYIDDHYGWQMPNGACVGPPPNYTQSLDACATFESLKDDDFTQEYGYELAGVCEADYDEDGFGCRELTKVATATPLQRCEAFLRLHGKWAAS